MPHTTKTNDDSDGHEQNEELVLCPKCLLANSPSSAFCTDCGAPIGFVSTIDPIQHIHAEGFAYRSAVDGPPSLIILIGMWLIFAPMLLSAPIFIFTEPNLLMKKIIFVPWTLLPACILYRTTKNYLVKRERAKIEEFQQDGPPNDPPLGSFKGGPV